MSYTVGNTQQEKEFINASEGVHNAVCVDIVDLGMQDGFEGKERHKMRLVFEVEETNEEGVPLTVSQQYGVSLHENSNLRKDLEKWRGRPFTAEELQKFDLDNLIGVPCQVVVTHNYSQKNEKTYANVDNILRAKVKLAPSGHYTRRRDRDDWMPPKRSPWNKPEPQRNSRPQTNSRPPARPAQGYHQPRQPEPVPQQNVPTERINRPLPSPVTEQSGSPIPSF